ncbi:DUF6777 domain-containing protein [Kitasatospora sp. NPDC052896]|uniref:DUF6777 domain-containing protein n=1 Tax=Kitasatospora sp. NPDC052896 TaxID=3364061 RepID=UPI0037C50F90
MEPWPHMVMAGGDGGPRRPWWRRPRSLALGAVVAGLVVGLGAVLVERQPETNQPVVASVPVLLQAADEPGPDPFTGSVASSSAGPSGSPSGGPPLAVASASTVGSRSVDGGTAGLYGGTERLGSCEVAKLTDYLVGHVDKAHAWAGVEGVRVGDIPFYLGRLTPVVLRSDTRVTNHGFADGLATGFQSVLRAGTAVLIDNRGLPRVRCACGNPLLPPAVPSGPVTFTGPAWPGFRVDELVTVVPAGAPVTAFVIRDRSRGSWFSRPVGGSGGDDQPVPSPRPSASGSPSATETPAGQRGS